MLCYGWYWERTYIINEALKRNEIPKEWVEELRRKEFGKCETCLYETDCKWGATR